MPDARRPVVVAVDQGTSSTKALAIDGAGGVVGTATVRVGIAHPAAGHVEQDPAELAASVERALDEVAGHLDGRVAAVGLSTQRESAVLWDRRTGEPLGPMLGWQDRRTAPRAQRMGDVADRVRDVSGLPLDPMFSALKFAALLDAADPGRRRARSGELALGTVDSWLVFRATGEHRIEVGNASRTQLLDVATGAWSDELLDVFDVPRAALPEVVASDAASAPLRAAQRGVRIHGVLGDSHAALYGHGVRATGDVKVTLGTGSSVMGLLPAGARAGDGLATTVAWGLPRPVAAFEGNVLATGAVLVWLAGVLGTTPGDLLALAHAAPASGRVDLVPAFGGLGAPWWSPAAEAALTGFDLGTSRADIARAAVESIPLQIDDVLRAAEAGGGRIDRLRVDGGPAADDRLVQLLADLTQRDVVRPGVHGLSALGAAQLAGVAAGVWTDEQARGVDRRATTFAPRTDPQDAARRHERWSRAVATVRATADHRPRFEEEHP